MGARIREFDWSRTPLGPIASWPQSLLIATRIMLDAKYPMAIQWGAELIYLYNDPYVPFLGKRHPDALGRHFAAVWPEAWPVLGPQYHAVLNEGASLWHEEVKLILQRNGYDEETYFTFSYSPLPDGADGVGGVLCIAREDTAKVLHQRRLRALAELGSMLTQKRQVHELYQVAVDTLNSFSLDVPFALLYVLDDQGRSASLAARAGISGKDGEEGAAVNFGQRAAVWPFQEALEAQKPVLVGDLPARFAQLPGLVWPQSTQRAVVLPLRKAGQAAWKGFLVVGINPRLDYNEDYEEFLELVAGQVAASLSRARLLEEEQRHAANLAELDRAKTAFLANVSHEFRTPLTLMLGPLEEVAALEEMLPAPARDSIEIVRRNSFRLLKLVNSLVDFLRIESGRVESSFVPTDLAAFTADLCSLFRSAVEIAGMRLIVDCPPLSQPVYVDREMWETIVVNLLSNALKFTLKGEIAVTLREAGGKAALTVRDTGIGIDESEIPFVFERFYRVRGAQGRSREGTGIGLAMVQELVKLHSGEVFVESEVGGGSRFSVSIPLGAAHLPAGRIGTAASIQATVEALPGWVSEESREPVALPVASAASGPRSRILFADDSAGMRDYVRRLLGRAYEVTVVNDGVEALEAARKTLPDLVLSDVQMPNMDGLELVKTVRGDEVLKTVPVVLLSASAAEQQKAQAFESGVDDYLVKPFSARELLARIEAHLKLAGMRKESEETIRRNEERFRTLISVITHVPWTTDAEGKIASPIPAWEAYTGQTWEEYRGFGWLQAIHPDDREQVQRIWLRAIENRDSVYSVEYRLWRAGKDEWRYVLASAGPMYAPDGSVREWVGTCTDMHDRKQAENECQKFVDLVENSSDFVGIAALDGQLEYVNQAGQKLVGLSGDDDIGKTRIEDYISAECLEEFRETVMPTLRTEGDWQGEMVFRHTRTGRGIPMLESIFFVRDHETGTPTHIATVARDISERKRSEDELKRANADLEQFAHSIAHDLKEPLRGATIFSDLLAKRTDAALDAQSRQFLDHVRTGAARMRMLIDDLLAYAGVGSLDLANESADCNAAAAAAVANLVVAMNESNAKVSWDTLPVVRAHAMHLEQLFQNLIGNAIKYRALERPPVIEISAKYQGCEWNFAVTDNGIGIAPEHRELIFGMFRRVHSTGYTGTGIGLALCQRIVERYGGRIWVEPGPDGVGSTFYFTLPE